MTPIHRRDGRNNALFYLICERQWAFSKGASWHEETVLNLPLHRRLHSHVVTTMLQDANSNH